MVPPVTSDISIRINWIGIALANFNVEGSTIHSEENFILVGISIGCIDTVIGCIDGDISTVDGDRFSFETFDRLAYLVGSAIDDQITRSMDAIGLLL